MAKRHNVYSRLLGTVENDIHPLTEQMPATGVPDLHNIANDCAAMGSQLIDHSKHLHGFAAMQPDWQDVIGEQEDIGLPASGY